MKSEILQILRERKNFVSGQELCGLFGVSRTAVWKAISQLKEDGYVVESVTNKGYRLLEEPELVTREAIESKLATKWAGRTLCCLEEVDSTNRAARELAEKGAPHGTLVVANRQNAGRGRRGRIWQMEPGTGIAMSLLLRPSLEPQKASMLTLVMGLAQAKALDRLFGLSAKIKWPNDLVIRGRKVSGTLTEMSAEMEEIHYVIIGTGINVNMTCFPEELKETATSLCEERGCRLSRAEIICACMEEFETCYQAFMEARDLRLLRQDYETYLVNKDRQVCVLDPAGEYTGTALGINDQGELLVETGNGIRTVFAGEVSVRGVYGYV